MIDLSNMQLSQLKTLVDLANDRIKEINEESQSANKVQLSKHSIISLKKEWDALEKKIKAYLKLKPTTKITIEFEISKSYILTDGGHFNNPRLFTSAIESKAKSINSNYTKEQIKHIITIQTCENPSYYTQCDFIHGDIYTANETEKELTKKYIEFYNKLNKLKITIPQLVEKYKKL